MNKNDPANPLINTQNDRKKHLKDLVQSISAVQNLESQRLLIKVIAAELNMTVLDCAAALVYLNESTLDKVSPGIAGTDKNNQPYSERQNAYEKPLPNHLPQGIRLVRYRLDVGHQHKVTLDELKKLLVEESGVDIKNIANVRIQECYTLIDLPDEMPQEIFHHLRMVEINGQKLDIRRVKARNKKRGSRRHRHARSVNSLPVKELVNEIGNLSSGSSVD